MKRKIQINAATAYEIGYVLGYNGLTFSFNLPTTDKGKERALQGYKAGQIDAEGDKKCSSNE